ncbi:MAG: transketolase C-terminal domain-containing protein [Sulfuritalea sp.]|nr:transketolase C-terminal domain-containing protein [Sulfuritalea sp.]
MRNAFAEAFYEAACEDQRLCMVVADLSPAGSMEKFRERFPRRFINTGVAEQAMIGLAAGLAASGLRPFAYTIATFALYRPFEFVRDDLCYQNLPVTVVGMGAGLSYSTLGSTHHAQEDVAVACALPNLTVLAPCDPAETRLCTRWCATEARGPVYLRLGKADEPDLTTGADTFRFGKLRYLQRGADVCILGYGPILERGRELARRLEAQGESVSLVSAHTLKPLDVEGIVQALASHRRMVVLEEMTPHGLGLRVKAIAHDCMAWARIEAFALRDEFIHCYGTRDDILAAHGLGLDTMEARI